MCHVLQWLRTGDQVFISHLPMLAGAFDQNGLVQASRTCCHHVNTALLLQQLCFFQLQPEPPLPVARGKSPWKHPPGNALLRGRDCGIQHNQTIGICPGDFSIWDFSIWVCSAAAKHSSTAPHNTTLRPHGRAGDRTLATVCLG